MQYFIFSSVDPKYNLALEEALFEYLPENHPGIFLLWQNKPAVIIGKNQCTIDEINDLYIKRWDIPVIRRNTGGGAVWHDLGNLNFSFIDHVNSKKINLLPYMDKIARALKSIDINVSLTGRNDLEINKRKISGSGQLVKKGKVLHHGTLLVRSNIDRMQKALKISEHKLASKGVKSVRARVVNISEICKKKVNIGHLKRVLCKYCAKEIFIPNEQIFIRAKELVNEKYGQWHWNYGESPQFSEEKNNRFSFGSMTLRYMVNKGKIIKCNIYGDFFSMKPINTIENMLEGSLREPLSLFKKVKKIPWHEYFDNCNIPEIAKFFSA